jgi:hypothetical protein
VHVLVARLREKRAVGDLRREGVEPRVHAHRLIGLEVARGLERGGVRVRPAMS